MRKAIVVGVGVLMMSMLVAGAEQQRLPLVAGKNGSDLRTEDITEIVKLTAWKDANAWLLEVRQQQWVTPPFLRVNAFLKPAVSTPRLRRGWVLSCYDRKRPGQEKRNWKLTDNKEHYAQVSPKDKPFASEFTLPSGADRPFWVRGNIRDEDLVGLVDFIRASPCEPTKTVNTQRTKEGYLDTLSFTEPVCGTYQILSISEAGLGSFEVVTERREGAGQRIRVKLQDGKWSVESVGMWVS